MVRAIADDAKPIQCCVAAAYEHYIERMGKVPGPMLEDYPLRIRENEVYVMRGGSTVVAVLVLILEPDHFLLDNIAVHPSQQGKGLGNKVMTFAENRALETGYSAVDLYTHEVMTENFAMYKKRGYVETERATVKGYDRIYMRKLISTERIEKSPPIS
ncbi:MAG: GNAT family N-acetyltransferase [Gammaproteobacteria bacterium]|nr:GNAT family N-acetyltransferase [Gammaproteobacteria bacterium]